MVSKARVNARADVAANVVALADAPNVELSEPAEFWDDNLLASTF